MALHKRKIRSAPGGTVTFFMFLLFWIHPGLAAVPALPTTVTAMKILSGDEFTIGDNRTVWLEGIKAPFIQSEMLAQQAHIFLEKLVTGKSLTLENASTDRYGRIAAQVFIPQNGGGATIHLQEVMLREGLALVYPPTGQEPGLDALLTAESEARTAKRGIWADEAYADTPDTETEPKGGHFAFVKGTVQKAVRVKDKVYLNFGADWRKDFSIAIAAHDLEAFRKAGIDPQAYEGKTIRVRGWVMRNPGPMITVTTPGQIQLIGNP